MMTGNKIPSLYLHVPFCRSICYYCDFKRQMYSEEQADRWINAVSFECSNRNISNDLETIYIGGGTPTSLSLNQLDRLLSLLDPYKTKVREYTVEMNPETVTSETLDCLVMHGVNRLSIGLQSGDDAILRSLNRRHTRSDVGRLVHQIHACGISNISLDLMYSLPGQTMEKLKDSVEFALSLNPSHLSLYSLTIEENSVFGKRGVQPLDEDTEADMYEWIVNRLCEAGYDHYEISNFAKDGKESLHNVNVWEYRDFYGIGYGAWGKDARGRYVHAKSIKEYLNDPLQLDYTELSIKEQMFETVMMGLRLARGISKITFQNTYGKSLDEVYPNTIRRYRSDGSLQETDDRLFCSEAGREILNTLLVGFMEESGL